MQESDLKSKIADLPAEPGVYFFMGAGDEILYVGKATSLHDRVKSYFGNDLHETRGPLLVQMVKEAEDIRFIQTDSALEALILEANWIRKAKPRYNTKEKDDKSYNYIVITKEDFPVITTLRGHDFEMAETSGGLPFKIKHMFGPYPNGGQLREALKIVRKIFPYRDPKCKLPVPGKPLRPCFNRQLGLCPGTCTGEISRQEYAKTIRNLKLFFEGRKKTLIRTLEKEMNAAAKSRNFEQAAKLRNTLFALSHIQDIALLKRDAKLPERNSRNGTGGGSEPMRLEAYDVAHISGTNVVGVMVAVEDGEVKKSDYRKFRIRIRPGVDDTGALKEVLDRRLNHTEWPTPSVILVDGGTGQYNAARTVLEARNVSIPIIAVTKNEQHRPEKFIGDKNLIEEYKNGILLANSEAHRFAVAYHRHLRGKLK